MGEVRKYQAFRRFVLSLWRASQRWNDAACVDLSAAFAYFTLQSFFPLLLIALSVAARVFGRTDSLDKLITFVAQILPPSAVDLVEFHTAWFGGARIWCWFVWCRCACIYGK